MRFEVENTRTSPTIKILDTKDTFYLHSKYDPIKEAKKWVNGNEGKIRESAELIVIGMGAGYHIRCLLEMGHTKKIMVFDFNEGFSSWLLESGLINDIIMDERVQYYPITSSGDLEFFLNNIQKNFIIYRPSLKIFLSEYYLIKNQLENLIIQERTIYDQKEKLFQNYRANIDLCDSGINKFEKLNIKSMILVSAGPL